MNESVLPPGSFVVEVTNPVEIKLPFAIGDEVTAAGGQALLLPEGAGSAAKVGRAVFAVEAPASGVYHLWIHAKWRDSCGNSLSVRIDDSPPYLAGQDAVYNTWHWVRAGRYNIASSIPHRLEIHEREDGIAVDQFLFTPDERFIPTAPVLKSAQQVGIRRFADDFARSPGHGMEAWDLISGKWEIVFSLDPNRIPHQYSLTGECGEGDEAAEALVKGPPWKGCRLEFSVLPRPGACAGAILEKNLESGLRLEFFSGPEQGIIHVSGVGYKAVQPLAAFKPSQWHRVCIERWAWVLRVFVDREIVFQTFDLEPKPGGVGLLVSRGSAVFDDVKVEEIPWQAEDARSFMIPWTADANALWYRATDGGAGIALIGRRGAIWTGLPGLFVQELLVETLRDGVVPLRVLPAVMEETAATGNTHLFTRRSGTEGASTVGLGVEGKDVRLRRVAVQYDDPVPDLFRVDLYHFTTARIEDPSDYLDFTEEEYKQIRNSPDAQKLIRQANWRQLVGGGDAIWNPRRGTWFLREGVLVGRGPDAVLGYWNPINSPLWLRMKVRRQMVGSTFEICLYGDANNPENGGFSVCLGETDEHANTHSRARLNLALPFDDNWHELELRAGNGVLSAKLDRKEPVSISCERGFGSELFLKIPKGSVELDDIELLVPRTGPKEFFYAFDRRETDWWREGGEWVDHGGIACVSGSTWISLVAPSGAGMLWNKRRFSANLVLALKIEENTEWFGWARYPTHIHYPFDNIRLSLASDSTVAEGYTLEVNSRNRSATVLYRNGQEVASVPQDWQFPIRYHGGHAPYSPRRNTILLAKQGAVIEAYINGQRILRFEDPVPLEVHRVGFGGYKTRVNFTEVVVRNLDEGENARNSGHAGIATREEK